MRRYSVGSPVLVHFNGELLSGSVRSTFDSVDPPQYYWVDFDVMGHKNCSLFTVEDLNIWNPESGGSTNGCECGGHSVGATRHPWYCPMYKAEL